MKVLEAADVLDLALPDVDAAGESGLIEL